MIMKSKVLIFRYVGLLFLLPMIACTEEIVLEAPEGKKRPVMEGYYTDELKRHEVILSYSSEL